MVHGLKEEDDPARFAELQKEMARNADSAYDLAAIFGVKDVIDPRETRAYPRGDARDPYAAADQWRWTSFAVQLRPTSF